MKIAVLGAGGMLGHKMYATLAAAFPDTWAVFRKCPAGYASFGIFDPVRSIGGFDARQTENLESFLDQLNADVVVNCVGLTTRKLAGRNESDIIVVNAVLPHRLKEWCIKNGRRLVHFSTDCVFSGDNGPYDEWTSPDADDLYGRSKALGEVAGPGILTIRSSIIGLEIEGRTELLEWFRSQRGGSARGFRNVLYSGVTTATMASVVAELLRRHVQWNGVHQLASAPISKFDLLALANEALDLEVTIAPETEPRSNKTLQPGRFFTDLGIQVPSWSEQLREVAKDAPKYERWKAHVERKSKAS